jgi:hypothetical protein
MQLRTHHLQTPHSASPHYRPPCLTRRCNPEALRHCLVAYRQQQQALQQPKTPRGTVAPSASLTSAAALRTSSDGGAGGAAGGARSGPLAEAAQSTPAAAPVPLSYVATCYTLLHELDLVEAAIKRVPQLWEVPTLEHLQRRLWGVLDEL